VSSIDEYIEILADLWLAEDYDPIDRYNDFRDVFLKSDQGRRVLKQILSWGRLSRSTAVGNPIDSLRMALGEGERNLVLQILAVMLVEPSKKLRKQTVVEKEK